MVKIDVTERENLLVVRSMINDRHDCGSIASFSATILLARSVYIYTDKCIYPVRIDLLCSVIDDDDVPISSIPCWTYFDYTIHVDVVNGGGGGGVQILWSTRYWYVVVSLL